MRDDAARAEAEDAARALWEDTRLQSSIHVIQRRMADALLTFAAQAAQRENEACALVAQEWAETLTYHHLADLLPDYPCYEHVKIAAAIRARHPAAGRGA